MFELSSIFFVSCGYLLLLFGSAFATDRGWIPAGIVRSAVTRTLAIGVLAGSVAFFASMNLAVTFGSSYLLYFLGASAAFLLAPAVISPLWRIARRHNLGSLADVFAFRYPGPWVGGTVTVFMLLGVIPLMAMQIQAVSASIHMLNQDLSQNGFAIVFCLALTIFAILFGARHVSMRVKHDGLVVAIALESAIKLVAMIVIAVIAVYSVFGDVATLDTWLRERTSGATQQLSEGASRSLLLLFFAGTVAMPHVYHMLFTENTDDQILSGLRWGVPAYLLAMSLTVAPIVWAATHAEVAVEPEYFALGISLHLSNQPLAMLAFIGGLAAASGVLIVTTLSLAAMTVNHLILPFVTPPGRDSTIVRVLLIVRHVLIAGMILVAYSFYRLLNADQNLISLGLIAFVAVLQFLPGLAGVFFWPRATRLGLITGLVAGFGVWFLTLMLPLLRDLILAQIHNSTPPLFELTRTTWHHAAQLSLSLNILVFLVVSLFGRRTQEEANAANECTSDLFTRRFRGELTVTSVDELEQKLTLAIGPSSAAAAISRAVSDIGITRDEARPHALQQIRDHTENQLSSMLGQTIAHQLVSNFLPYKNEREEPTPESIHSIESRLEDYRSRLTGLAAELDKLRRYHRQVLQDLPSAVCSISNDKKIVIWNRAMQSATGLDATQVVGSTLTILPAPWCELISQFVASDHTDQIKLEYQVDGESRLLNLHKASIDQATDLTASDLVIVIEDVTDSQRLADQLLHNERLAAIGQLAAGVAHEIGNPITGIACLAQNLRLETDNPELKGLATDILSQTERVSNILQSLVSFAHRGSQTTTRLSVPFNLSQCVDEAINLLSLGSNTPKICFENRCSPEAVVEGDPQRMAQVFVNLLSNARDASAPGAEVIVSATIDEDLVFATVEDIGAGVPPEQLKSIFDPFYTTKTPGRGTGMGLAIVTTIVEEHHGAIHAISPLATDRPGTRVEMRFPRYRQADATRPVEFANGSHS